jgi:hypothetical protein
VSAGTDTSIRRGMPVRRRIDWIALFALLLIGYRAPGQEFPVAQTGTLETAVLPVPAPTLDPRPQLNFEPQDQDFELQDQSQNPSAQQKKNPQDLQQGTSNDRILWTLPNFLTVENADSIPPLTPGQKFKVVARGVFDPFEFVLIGFVAGLGQASNSNPSYGQGMQGYAKRYGTAYGDNAIENFMGSAVLPTILHQDPRYYQLGHGGFWKRAEHAVSRVVVTRSDSGEKQANYSELLGALGAAAISTYTYHPQSERGFGNVASVWGSQMGWDAVTYMIKEFWPDLRKHSKHQHDLAANGESTGKE